MPCLQFIRLLASDFNIDLIFYNNTKTHTYYTYTSWEESFVLSNQLFFVEFYYSEWLTFQKTKFQFRNTTPRVHVNIFNDTLMNSLAFINAKNHYKTRHTSLNNSDLNSNLGILLCSNFMILCRSCLKGRYTNGNCQRPVFSFGVSTCA